MRPFRRPPSYVLGALLFAAIIGFSVSLRFCGSQASFGGAPRVILRDPGGYYHATYWSVSRAEAARADRGVKEFVATKNPAIAARYAEYYGQIFGTTDAAGHRVIHLNYFCEAGIYDAFRWQDPRTWGRARWTYELVEVEDGGQCFFNVDFDPATGTYENFRMNGDA